MLQLFLGSAAGFSQQVFPLLPYKLAVLGVSQPRLTAAKKHNTCGAQDDETGEQGQHPKTHKLSMGDEDAGGVDCLLQGNLEQISLRGSEELVESVSRKGVMLWSQSEHSVGHRPGTHQLGPGLKSVLQGTCWTSKPFLANAPECSIRLTNTCAPVGTGLAGAGRERGGVITGEAGEAVRTDAREGQTVVCTVATIEAGVRLAAVNTDLTEVAGKSSRA